MHSGTFLKIIEHSGTFCMHSGTVCMHSGTVCMHSGTFYMHSGTFGNILHALWNILQAFWNILEHSAICMHTETFWNILDVVEGSRKLDFQVDHAQWTHTDIRTCWAESLQQKIPELKIKLIHTDQALLSSLDL